MEVLARNDADTALGMPTFRSKGRWLEVVVSGCNGGRKLFERMLADDGEHRAFSSSIAHIDIVVS